MKTWKRYLTAWSRHHRSGGFGIHSPFAFNFVRTVLREPTPFYAYNGISQLVKTIRANITRRQRREMDLLGEREAKLLFRVTNFFNPINILQMGASTGVESVAMLAVRRDSCLYLFDPQIEQNVLAVKVLQTQLDRVEFYDNEQVAVDDFMKADSDGAMALVNVPVDEDLMHRLLDDGTVLVMRRLNYDEAMRNLFDSCCNHMMTGQTYTNGKIAILNPNPKLQREDFTLWL